MEQIATVDTGQVACGARQLVFTDDLEAGADHFGGIGSNLRYVHPPITDAAVDRVNEALLLPGIPVINVGTEYGGEVAICVGGALVGEHGGCLGVA